MAPETAVHAPELSVWTRSTLDRFDAICGAVARQRKGLSLPQLAGCHALARELESETPDPERVHALAKSLDLDPEALP